MSAQLMDSRLPSQRFALQMPLVLKKIAAWTCSRRESQTRPQRLRIVERVALGEKSSLSVVQVDGRRFLLASYPTNVTLLTELASEDSFEGAMSRALAESRPHSTKPRVRKSRTNKIVKEAATA